MRNKLFVVAALCLSGTAAQAAPVVSFTPGGDTVSGTVIQNFDSYADGAMISAGTYAHAGSNGDNAKPAFGASGRYASVNTDGSYSIALDSAKTLSFVLGSLDTYNTLTLGFANGTSMAYMGSQITNGGQADGNQTSPATNGVVSFDVGTGPRLVSATFTSSQNSFEFDNIAEGVPEPASWALMIAGFGFVGTAMRIKTADKRLIA